MSADEFPWLGQEKEGGEMEFKFKRFLIQMS